MPFSGSAWELLILPGGFALTRCDSHYLPCLNITQTTAEMYSEGQHEPVDIVVFLTL